MMLTATIAIYEVQRSRSYYCAEQYDSDLGLYYLRARYMNPVTGRFMSRDPEAGKPWDPRTLHKYLYAGGDPVNASDPTGRDLFEIVELDTRSELETVVVSKETLLMALCLYGIEANYFDLTDALLKPDEPHSPRLPFDILAALLGCL